MYRTIIFFYSTFIINISSDFYRIKFYKSNKLFFLRKKANKYSKFDLKKIGNIIGGSPVEVENESKANGGKNLKKPRYQPAPGVGENTNVPAGGYLQKNTSE